MAIEYNPLSFVSAYKNRTDPAQQKRTAWTDRSQQIASEPNDAGAITYSLPWANNPYTSVWNADSRSFDYKSNAQQKTWADYAYESNPDGSMNDTRLAGFNQLASGGGFGEYASLGVDAPVDGTDADKIAYMDLLNVVGSHQASVQDANSADFMRDFGWMLPIAAFAIPALASAATGAAAGAAGAEGAAAGAAGAGAEGIAAAGAGIAEEAAALGVGSAYGGGGGAGSSLFGGLKEVWSATAPVRNALSIAQNVANLGKSASGEGRAEGGAPSALATPDYGGLWKTFSGELQNINVNANREITDIRARLAAAGASPDSIKTQTEFLEVQRRNKIGELESGAIYATLQEGFEIAGGKRTNPYASSQGAPGDSEDLLSYYSTRYGMPSPAASSSRGRVSGALGGGSGGATMMAGSPWLSDKSSANFW